MIFFVAGRARHGKWSGFVVRPLVLDGGIYLSQKKQHSQSRCTYATRSARGMPPLHHPSKLPSIHSSSINGSCSDHDKSMWRMQIRWEHSPVDVFPITNGDNQHKQPFVMDFIDDPVRADTNPPAARPGSFLQPVGRGCMAKVRIASIMRGCACRSHLASCF